MMQMRVVQTSKRHERSHKTYRFPNKDKYPDLYNQWIKNCRRVKEPSVDSKDHTHVVPDRENAVKRKIQKLEEQNHELKKKLRNTTLREKRSKMTCKILINDLKQQNLVSSELETKLATFEEIPCDLFRKASHDYTQEQKDFAVTLHLYSSKAYSYSKRESGLALPEPRTLRR
ncbi:THAP domain containing 9 [Mactra antiquata]